MVKTIAWVAQRADVKTQTVLYYERRGLVQPIRRTASGYRVFDDTSVRRIRFVRRAQELGFTLKKIATLLALQEETGAVCSDISDIAAEHLAEIEKKIQALKHMRKTLIPLIDACPRTEPVRACPILSSLEGDQ